MSPGTGSEVSACIWTADRQSVWEAHLVRNGEQSLVQLLHQLLERRSLVRNGVPALSHQHVSA